MTNKTDLPPMTATEDKVLPTKRAYDEDLVTDAQREAKAMAREGMKHPSTKPVLKGAAIGAVAGIVLPLVGPIIGAAAGGSYMFYKRLRP
ncbi:MAG: hypothetical protein ABJM58_04930 [Alteripontixanthobacter sp.]